MPRLREYPLILTSRELVAGNGFLASVSGCGRVLMVPEGEEWWLYGVEPGGIGEGGGTPQEAHLQFINALRSILYDIAARATSFGEFSAPD